MQILAAFPPIANIRSDAATGSPFLSVVVCTFNRSNLLSQCLTELLRQASEVQAGLLEILVVNNNSSDNTAQVCLRFIAIWPRLRYVFEPSQGLSQARNRGAKESSATYIAYLDDDALPGPEYLQNLIAVLDRQAPDIAGGPVFPFYTSPKPFWFQDEIEVRQHIRETGFFDCPISGGNFIIRRGLLLSLGMFSPDYGMLGRRLRLGEERNLIERYRAETPHRNRKIYYSQNCFVYHHVPVEKMRIGYLARRAFESGRMRVALNKELAIRQTGPLVRISGGINRLGRLIRGGSGVYLPIRVVHHVAMIVGIIFAHLSDWLSGRIKIQRIDHGSTKKS